MHGCQFPFPTPSRSVRTPFPTSLAGTLRQSSLFNSSTPQHAQHPLLPPLTNSPPTDLPIRCLPLTQLSSAHRLRSQTFWPTFTPPQPMSLSIAHSASRQATEIRFSNLTILFARLPTLSCPLPTPTNSTLPSHHQFTLHVSLLLSYFSTSESPVPTHKQVWTSSWPCLRASILWHQ